MTANELADELTKMFRGEEYDRLVHEIPDLLRQQAKEIKDLKNANRFIQNFAEEQHRRAVALENELDRIVELYTDKAIESEQLTKELGMLKQIIDANNLQSDIGQFKKASEK